MSYTQIRRMLFTKVVGEDASHHAKVLVGYNAIVTPVGYAAAFLSSVLKGEEWIEEFLRYIGFRLGEYSNDTAIMGRFFLINVHDSIYHSGGMPVKRRKSGPYLFFFFQLFFKMLANDSEVFHYGYEQGQGATRVTQSLDELGILLAAYDLDVADEAG